MTISIHAPREGCDPPRPIHWRVALIFQSTHPVRGATSTPNTVTMPPHNFNPRTP